MIISSTPKGFEVWEQIAFDIDGVKGKQFVIPAYDNVDKELQDEIFRDNLEEIRLQNDGKGKKDD